MGQSYAQKLCRPKQKSPLSKTGRIKTARIKKGAVSAPIVNPKLRYLVIKQRFLSLLNLGFFEFNMLAHDGVVFAEAHFFCGIARVFLSYIEKASVSSAEQFDFDSGWLRHNPFLLFESKLMQERASAPLECAANAGLVLESQ
jgi:hypothetical protein